MNSEQRLEEKNRVNRHAWLFFAVLSLPYLLVYFHRVAPAVVADVLMSEFQLTGAVLGNLAAIYFYVYTLMQVPAGVVADAYGARRTVFAGMMLSGAGSVLFACAAHLTMAFLGRVLIGLGVSVIFVSILKIVTEWFPDDKFGTMSGITLLIGNSGAIVASMPLAYIVSLWGWRSSFSIVGVIGLLAGLLTVLIVKDRPADLDLPSPNPTAPSQPLSGLKDILSGLKNVFKNPLSWPPFFLFFGIYGSLMAFQGVWGVPFLVQQYHQTRMEASASLMVIAFGLVVGCPLAGFISDRLKRRKLPLAGFTIGYILCWTTMLAWPGGKPAAGILPVLFFVMGLFASGFIIVWACAKEVNDPALSGCAMGLVNMGGFLGAAIMQPLFGWALDRNWKGLLADGVRVYSLEAFRFAFIILTAALLLSTIPLLFIRETHAGAPGRSCKERPIRL